MQVIEVANKLKVSADTVRYYCRIGLVTPKKNVNGYKDFSTDDYRKLRFALRAKSLGFSLSDIKTLINMSDHGETPCPIAREVITRNLETMTRSVEESVKLLERMKKAVSTWQEMPNRTPDGETICSLIETWDEEDDR